MKSFSFLTLILGALLLINPLYKSFMFFLILLIIDDIKYKVVRFEIQMI